MQADKVETDWAALVFRVRDHQDKAAFAALFRHFAPRVKAFLMKSGADATLAEECAQDVMATLWQKARLFDAERASVATWVFTIARNRRIDTSTIKTGCNWALRAGTWTVALTNPDTGAKTDVKARYSFLYQYDAGVWEIEHLHSSVLPEKP